VLSDRRNGSSEGLCECAELRARVEALESALHRGGHWLRAAEPTGTPALVAVARRFVYRAADGSRWEWVPASRVAPAILDEIESKLRSRIVDRDRARALGLLLLQHLRAR